MAYTSVSRREAVTVEEPAGKGLSDSTKWIITGSILGALLILSAVLYFTITRVRAKKIRDAERLRQRVNSNLARNQFARVRKLSSADQEKEQEQQRASIIRKSLATRSTTSSMSSMMSRYSNIPHRDEEEGEVEDIDLNDDNDSEDERSRSRGLRDDWKEFEARINRERSNSGEMHPCIAETERRNTSPPPQSRVVSLGYSPYSHHPHHPSPTTASAAAGVIPQPRFPPHPPAGLHPALAASMHPLHPSATRPESRRDISPYGMSALQPVRPARVARV